MFSKLWWMSTLERLAKTFVQGYFAFFTMVAGAATGPVDDVSNVTNFELLFTMNNVKAGLVAAAISFFMSMGSTPLGPDKGSPSMVVTETTPAALPMAA